tara:strand:+ start:3807 stop:4421 length:615 start_codon:yes stop_codon:yes gene_type:complete
MSHQQSDSASCKPYFNQGKSFPDNVKDVVCGMDEVVGSTGPTGPAGGIGPTGSGVYIPALTEDILEGTNGSPDNRDIDTYVNPSGWYHASNQFAPLVETKTLLSETYYPDVEDHNIFDLTISGSCILGYPRNMKNGRTVSFVVRQHLNTNGNNLLNMDPAYEFDGGYNQITLTSGAKDVIVSTKINDFLFCTMANDIKTGISTT